MQNLNQPAFPPNAGWEHSEAKGLSKREWFAAHAPIEIPNWFTHVPPEKKLTRRPIWLDIDNEQDRETCRHWLDGEYDLPEHLKWFSDQFSKAYDEEQQWNIENESERYFQWRVHYADIMLHELQKVIPLV
jgi:hypothetical protein